MHVFNDLSLAGDKFAGGVLSIGKFDGLHRGHAEILARAVAKARRRNAHAVVFTFDPSPAAILRPQSAHPKLCDADEKLRLLENAGVDAAIIFPTTREFLDQTAEDFFRAVVVEQLRVSELVEGASFAFGRNKEGRGKRLEELCAKYGAALEIVPSVEIAGETVSSSSIRASLARGDVESAALKLGRPYRLRGVVERGDMRGRTLGYPTANLGNATSMTPGSALYAARAILTDGRVFPAAVNLGGNPTFGIESVKIEAHLLGFSGDLYGQPLALDFLRRVRDVVRFNSREELLAKMAEDVETVRRIAGE